MCTEIYQLEAHKSFSGVFLSLVEAIVQAD